MVAILPWAAAMSSGASGTSGTTGTLLSFLQSELLVLSNEARKKHVEIKDALDKVFTWLRELKEAPGQIDIAVELGQSHDLLVPLMLASRTGNAKMLSIAVSCLHRLITYNALSADKDTAETVFAVLSEAVKASDEVQLKALQCIMPLLSNSASGIHGKQLIQAYLIGFRLYESSSPTVNNAAVAIVRQLVIWLFERVAEEDSGSPRDGPGPFATDALAIFRDICLLMNDEKPEVLEIKSVDKSFALELIESVLAYHSRIFRQHPEYVAIVQEKICTAAVRNFTENSIFPHSSRLWRVVLILLRDFHDLLPLEAEIFISFLPRILDDDQKAEWEKNLVLETAREIFNDHELMLDLYEICDKRQDEKLAGPKVFQDIIIATSSLVMRETSKAADAKLEVDYSMANIKVSLLSQFDKASPPPVPKLYSLHLAFDILCVWINGMNSIFSEPGKWEEDIVRSNDECKELLEKTHRQVIQALFSFFSTDLQSEWRRMLFSVLESLGKLFGRYHIVGELQSLLEALVNLETKFHLWAWQACLKIAIFNPEVIIGAWPVIINVLHSVDIYTGMKARKITYSNAAATPVPLSALESPVKKLSAAAAAKTAEASKAALGSQIELDRLAGLTSLARELLEMSPNFSAETFTLFIHSLGLQAVESKSDLFLVSRFKQAILRNIERFFTVEGSEEAWAIFQKDLLLLLTAEDPQLRTHAVEFMGTFCESFFATVTTEKFKKDLLLQQRILHLFADSIKGERTKHRDVVQLSIEGMGKLIQMLGPCLVYKGWLMVFEFISAFNELLTVSDLGLLRASFYCVKLVASDFLPYLDDESMRFLLKLVKWFVQQTEDLNISLTSIGIVWDTSDFLRLQSSKEDRLVVNIFPLWITAMELLSEASIEARPEIRNSSVQTVTRTIEIFALTMKPDEWTALLQTIIQPLLEQVLASSEQISSIVNTSMASLSLHHSRDSAAKQWDETLVLAVQGAVKIYSQFYPALSSLPDFNVYWSKLMKIIEQCCQPSKSIEVVSVNIACFKHLIQSITSIEVDDIWRCSWKTWENISDHMLHSKSFTQETLETYASSFEIFHQVFSAPKELSWLVDSFSVLDRSLKCDSPKDHVKDVEQLSPLQQTIVKQINDVVQYDEWGLGAKENFVGILSNWIELAPELRSLEMTRKNSVRRSRNSAPPSRPKSPVELAATPGSATYIALSVRILGLFEQKFSTWSASENFYKKAYNRMTRSIGRLMVLKYRAASPQNSRAVWKLATESFQKVFSASKKEFLTCGCWESIVEILEKSLESSRCMVPINLVVEELQADEEFDISHLSFIKTVILPEMKHVDERILKILLKALEHSSHLYYTKQDSPKLSAIEIPSTTNLVQSPTLSCRTHLGRAVKGELIPVIKERFALTCLQSLFDICSRDSPSLSRNVSHVALKILLDRVWKVIELYVKEKELLGDIPFPRIRQDEILFVLSACSSLRLAPNLAVEAAEKETETGLRQALLATDVGHLFHLYPILISATAVDDVEVTALLRCCFEAIGKSTGLMC